MSDELIALRAFLGGQREMLVAKLDDLTLEQATSIPTVSDLSVFAIVKHCAFVERRWVLGVIAQRVVPGVVPPVDRPQEFRADPGEDLDWLRAFYADVVRDNDEVLEGMTDPGERVGRDRTVRDVLLHLLEEVSQHHGHADIIREAIDGTKEPA